MPLATVSRLAALAILTFLSLLLAVFGAFLVPRQLVPGVSLGVALAVVGNYAVARSARRAARTTVAAGAPALAWLAAVMTLAGARSEGDVVLTGSAPSLAFILLGAGAAAVALGRPLPSEPDDPGADTDPVAGDVPSPGRPD